MKFLALLVALVVEQMHPLRDGNPVYVAYERYVSLLERQLNAGQHHHGVIAWVLAVGPLALITIAVHYALHAIAPLLAWVWSIGVLYLTMGFRQFSRYFTEILHALREPDLAKARASLARWQASPAEELTPSEVARVSIELALVGSHRHLFGPIAWFIVAGPVGPIVYRASSVIAEKWGRRRDPEFGDFGMFAQKVFFWLDWLPARITAASFAVVGNFEDAIYCWRTQALAWARGAHGIILASGGGALGVKLGDALHQDGALRIRPELGFGEEADVDYMQSALGLIWRALVLWMFLLLVVTVAHSLG